MRLLLLVAALAALAVLAAGAAFASRQSSNETLATVDGASISQGAYDDYASVFTTPDGRLRISRDDVLVSLMNQALVERAAKRLGVGVTAEDVSRQIGEMQEQHAQGALPPLPEDTRETAFRERMRLFLLFRLVKAQVIGPIDVPDAALEAAYEDDPKLHVLTFDEASAVIRKRMVDAETERRWVEWLASQRACATIEVLVPGFGVASSTPAPECIR